VLFVHNTSQVEDEPYPKLLQEKGFGGFPSLAFMDADGNVVVKPSARSVSSFEETLTKASEQMKRRHELTAKAKAGDAAAQKELFLMDLELGGMTAEQLNEGAKKLQLSKEEKTKVDEALTDLELKSIAAKTRGDRDAAAEQIAGLAKAGRRPSKGQAFGFWSMTLQHAAKAKDGKLADQAYGEIEKVAEENKQLKARLPQLQKLVEQAKEK
jgi:hypothetical protein